MGILMDYLLVRLEARHDLSHQWSCPMGSRNRVVERPIPGELLAHGVPPVVGNAPICIEPKRVIWDCSPARPRSPSRPHPAPDRLTRKALKAVHRWRRGSLALVPVRQRHDWRPTVRTLIDSHDRAERWERCEGGVTDCQQGYGTVLMALPTRVDVG
jgi:hypothetical protein